MKLMAYLLFTQFPVDFPWWFNFSCLKVLQFILYFHHILQPGPGLGDCPLFMPLLHGHFTFIISSCPKHCPSTKSSQHKETQGKWESKPNFLPNQAPQLA